MAESELLCVSATLLRIKDASTCLKAVFVFRIVKIFLVVVLDSFQP